MKKKAYWAILKDEPKKGERIDLTKVQGERYLTGNTYIEQKRIKTTPIRRIKKIGENMCCIYTDDAIYFAYCAKK